MKLYALLLALSLVPAMQAQADEIDFNTSEEEIAEFDPSAPEAMELIEQFEYDMGIESEVEEENALADLLQPVGGCYRSSCAVWALVDKSEQRLYVYVNGALTNPGGWKTSTGSKGRGTPNFDKHPDGRIWDKYSSKKFPGGDYNGLGNMPYAIFIKGGYAMHGTPRGNWSKLGTVASHGCIRMHPDNAFILNRLVRKVGVKNTWITVQP